MTKIGLMILLAHLKFCWRILNFAGAVFEVKLRQQTTCASKILLALRQKIPTLSRMQDDWIARMQFFLMTAPILGTTNMLLEYCRCESSVRGIVF
jgi:hypothetical protein